MKKLRKMAELTKWLSRAKEALKKAREERNVSLRINEELGQTTEKKDVDIKKLWAEVTKEQAYVTEYLMQEEEYVQETAKAKEEVESMRKIYSGG